MHRFKPGFVAPPLLALSSLLWSGCARSTAAGVTVTANPVVAPAYYDSNLAPFSAWTIFSREGPNAARVRYKPASPAEAMTIELSALTQGPMGLNLRVPGLRGQVTFDYRIEEADSGPQFAFFVIPVQASSESPYIPIEYGSSRAGDPGNASSPFRAKYFVPVKSINGQWHTQTLDFDFRNLHGTSEAIVAPRVNEGTASSAPGRWMLRNISVRIIP